jgi:PAS domain S-box-containing protein
MAVAQQSVVAAKPASEGHLRLIIETQPVCLTRVGPDGTFLAVNDAALSMLGAERLDQVLATSLLSLIETEQRDAVREFLTRVAAGERGSVEADLKGLGGTQHNVQIHAVPHPSPVDGLPSALCTFRDVTEHRRLEAAVVENAARPAVDESQLQRMVELENGRQELEATIAQQQARLSELEQFQSEAEVRARELEEQSAARQELESTLAGQQSRVAELESSLAEAEAKVRELSESITATHELEQMLLDQQTRLAQAQEALAGAEARATEATEKYKNERSQWQQRVDDALDARARDEQALRTTVAELERRRAQLVRAAALARDIVEQIPDSGTIEPISVGNIARAMEPVLAALVGSNVELVMVAASTEPVPDVSREDLEEMLLSLTAGRRAAMTAGGQITIEVADVTIDDACAKERRGFRPGTYVLLALHATGPGVAGGLPAGLFGVPPDQQLWRAAGPGMASLYSMIMNCGGYVWVAHEGRDAIAFELYFPRVPAPDAPAPLFA